MVEPGRINIGSDHANMNILLNRKSVYFKGFLHAFFSCNEFFSLFPTRQVKILEDEVTVVGNNLRSLEVSEGEVC